MQREYTVTSALTEEILNEAEVTKTPLQITLLDTNQKTETPLTITVHASDTVGSKGLEVNLRRYFCVTKAGIRVLVELDKKGGENVALFGNRWSGDLVGELPAEIAAAYPGRSIPESEFDTPEIESGLSGYGAQADETATVFRF